MLLHKIYFAKQKPTLHHLETHSIALCYLENSYLIQKVTQGSLFSISWCLWCQLPGCSCFLWGWGKGWLSQTVWPWVSGVCLGVCPWRTCFSSHPPPLFSSSASQSWSCQIPSHGNGDSSIWNLEWKMPVLNASLVPVNISSTVQYSAKSRKHLTH